ncbi:hypothetical protein V5O48_008642 [Marasmius crinis-equi]|uniref:Uncharacterized protein n=1 Tax=Marasmius crinis-equi TaxID=585013 RepID=A0ABR3FDW4_9AGAR
MKHAAVLAFVASSLASPQFWTTNAEGNAGTTTCVTWTFPDGSVTTYTAPPAGATGINTDSDWTGGTSNDAITLSFPPDSTPTTNAESDVGTTTCVTWTFPDGSVSTYTVPGPGGTNSVTASPTITQASTPTITCSCPPRQTVTTTVHLPSGGEPHVARAGNTDPCNCGGPVTTTIFVSPP